MPGVVIIDPVEESAVFATGDDTAAAVYTDIEDDKMYLSDLSNILEWEGNTASNQTATWKSGRIILPKPINPGAVKVDAAAYTSILLYLYAERNGNMDLITTLSISSNEPERLPGGYTSNAFEFTLETTNRIYSVTFGESIYDLSAG